MTLILIQEHMNNKRLIMIQKDMIWKRQQGSDWYYTIAEFEL